MRVAIAAGRARLEAALAKELRQFLRDPVLLVLVFWLYTIEVAICALALQYDLHDEATAIVDLDASSASVGLAGSFDRSAAFHVVAYLRDENEAAAMLDAGRVRLVVVVPPRFATRRERNAQPPVQLLVDGANSMIGRMVLGHARALLSRASMDDSPDRAAAAAPRIENRMRIWYNPDLRYVYFVVISMLAIGAYMVGVIHPAASVVKEKETGTIEQLVVSPLRLWEMIVAKAVPTFVVGLTGFAPGLLVARAFGVPFRGDPIAFLVVSAAFLLSAIATGLLIGSLVRTLQQALLVSFFVLFPLLFLSGTMTPIESMPPLLQQLSRLSPLRYYMDALLGIFLKGSGWRALGRPLGWLLGLGAGWLAIAAVAMRRDIG